MKINLYSILFLSLAFARPAIADMVEFSGNARQESITINVPDTDPHKVFTVPDPNRLVVDVPSVPGKHVLELPDNYKGKLVKALRFGQFDPQTSRFVFDLNHAIRVTDTRMGKGQIIIQIAPSDSMADTSPPQLTPPPLKKLIPVASKKPAKNAKPLIVIDPGHGGVDPGTIGPNDTEEKDVVLAIGLALRDKLLKSGRYRVIMTRDDDRFIMLRERVAIARRAHANLFISLHADSDPEGTARGLSLYSLSEQASDKEAEALAARENKADVLAGMDLSDERQDVADILISLAQRETNNRSATLGDELVSELDGKVKLLPNSHRFAGFAVLKAPDIPSVLVETGFLSHEAEEKTLNSKAYRDKITSGIISGIDDFFSQKKKADGE